MWDNAAVPRTIAISYPSIPLALGTQTQWGKIAAVSITGGERYYFMVSGRGRNVAMLPADVVELSCKKARELDAAPKGLK